MIIPAEKDRNNKELLAIDNVNKTTIAEVAKMSSAIDLNSKYNLTISNINININKILKLTSIKKS